MMCAKTKPRLPFSRSHCLLPAKAPQPPAKAIGVCTLSVRIGRKEIVHLVSVVPQLLPPFLVGADLLVRLGAQLDTVAQHLALPTLTRTKNFI